MTPHRSLFLLLAITLWASGCVSLNSPTAQKQLQIISAGHTGCMPDDNVISNVVNYGSNVTFNATCKSKIYLCSAAYPSPVSCAPVAQ
jgi:hypothetical protein